MLNAQRNNLQHHLIKFEIFDLIGFLDFAHSFIELYGFGLAPPPLLDTVLALALALALVLSLVLALALAVALASGLGLGRDWVLVHTCSIFI